MNIYVIPDTQVKPGVKNPLIAIAHHIAELKPQYIIHMGDHWDFPSLSLYDKGKKSHRVRNYLDDVRSGNQAMKEFFDILKAKWPRHKSKCKKILLRGNHEERRNKAIEYGPDELVTLIEEFPMYDVGWDRIIPFLKEVNVGGVQFCHYFQQNNSHRPISSARALNTKRHTSCIAAHQQGFDYHEDITGGGKIIQSMIIGSCYYHNETYKTHTNHHFRGSVLLKNVKSGMYDFERFSLKHL
jgi:hypothetical protein